MGTITIDTQGYTDDQRQEFIDGWEEAGGYMDDDQSDAPWCAPWYHGGKEIAIACSDTSHVTPREAGAAWWEACREEVESLEDNSPRPGC